MYPDERKASRPLKRRTREEVEAMVGMTPTQIREALVPVDREAAIEAGRKLKRRKWQALYEKAAEANFALDQAARLAGVRWETVLEWCRDKEFVDGWSKTRVLLNEQMFGTSVEMALGRRLGEDPETGQVIKAPPDGAMLRHLQGALDERFAKKTTVQHTGTVDVHVSTALGTMTDEEKRAELRRLLADDVPALEAQFEAADGGD